MPEARPHPQPRGGRRPGAGALPGNTNALITGAHARRSSDARRLIAASYVYDQYYRDLQRDNTPENRQRRRNLIDAAQHVIDTHKNLAQELEALIIASLEYRTSRRTRFRYILQDLARPADPTRPLDRALRHMAWLTRHDGSLMVYLTGHIRDDLTDKFHELNRKTIKRPPPPPPPSEPVSPDSKRPAR